MDTNSTLIEVWARHTLLGMASAKQFRHDHLVAQARAGASGQGRPPQSPLSVVGTLSHSNILMLDYVHLGGWNGGSALWPSVASTLGWFVEARDSRGVTAGGHNTNGTSNPPSSSSAASSAVNTLCRKQMTAAMTCIELNILEAVYHDPSFSVV